MSHIDPIPTLKTSFGPFYMIHDNILGHWSIARKWLVPAIETAEGTFTEDEIVGSLLSRSRKLIYGQESALIWEDAGFTGRKVIHFFLCGGNLKEIQEASPIVFELAKKVGFTRAHVSGRRGWGKAFPALREYCTTYSMDL